MDSSVIEGLRTIGESLDAAAPDVVADLRFTLMTLGSYAQRRDLAADSGRSGRVRVAKEALREAERWYARLPRAVRWRGEGTQSLRANRRPRL